MAFQLSPGVLVTEEDRTGIVPAVATTIGAVAGAFQWGPVDEVVSINSEPNLVERFGRPTDLNSGYFFTAANFLSYGTNLRVVRVVDKSVARNAVASPLGIVSNVSITSFPPNIEDRNFTVVFADPNIPGGTRAQGNVIFSPGRVVEMIVTNPGLGYSAPPFVSVSGGSGTGVVANVDIIQGQVKQVFLQSQGTNYNANSNVVFVGGGLPFGGTTATANLVIEYTVASASVGDAGDNYTSNANAVITGGGGQGATANLQLTFKLVDIAIGDAGDNYTSNANVQISGNGSGADVSLVLGANGEITGFVINDAGSGYTAPPTVIINRNDELEGNDASVTAVIGNGRIANVIITGAGSGYTSVPNIVINRNDSLTGNDAVVTAVLSATGTVTGVNIVNEGFGYTSAPSLVFNRNNSLGGANAAAISRIEGAISSVITITNQGSGFTTTPDVTFVPVAGDSPSSTAAATAVLNFTPQSVVISNPGSGYTSAPNVTIQNTSGQNITTQTTISQSGILIENDITYDNNFISGGLLYGEFAARFAGELGNSIRVSMADSQTFATWEYSNRFDSAPGTSPYAQTRNITNDEVHVIVIDAAGKWTGVAGATLERFQFLSKASDAKNSDGRTNYYKDVLNNQSSYVRWMNHPLGTSNWGATVGTVQTYDSLSSNVAYTLSGGVDSYNVDSNILSGYTIFENDELYDIGLIAMGPVSSIAVINGVISIAENRRDCLVFVSPRYEDVVNTLSTASKVVAFRDQITSSSFAVMDSGWKYQYDRYNDRYRYVPLNGDTAGLVARTDYVADPWFSPAGYNRGIVKNVVKLAYSPSKDDRDSLYRKGVNPVVTFPGQGNILFGDKTMLARPSAFDRINVRRLFIVLEKAIATASKFQLFEFNDAFTRAQFRNLIEPFLRDVQGRRGITNFRVICDETNNTPEIIDRNEFIADIFIQPARSINFIQLNFIATRTGVEFEEIGA